MKPSLRQPRKLRARRRGFASRGVLWKRELLQMGLDRLHQKAAEMKDFWAGPLAEPFQAKTKTETKKPI